MPETGKRFRLNRKLIWRQTVPAGLIDTGENIKNSRPAPAVSHTTATFT